MSWVYLPAVNIGRVLSVSLRYVAWISTGIYWGFALNLARALQALIVINLISIHGSLL